MFYLFHSSKDYFAAIFGSLMGVRLSSNIRREKRNNQSAEYKRPHDLLRIVLGYCAPWIFTSFGLFQSLWSVGRCSSPQDDARVVATRTER